MVTVQRWVDGVETIGKLIFITKLFDSTGDLTAILVDDDFVSRMVFFDSLERRVKGRILSPAPIETEIRNLEDSPIFWLDFLRHSR